MAFAGICKNIGCDPNAAYAVTSTYSAMVYNAQLQSGTVNKSNFNGWFKDPLTYLHGGNPSWYQGCGLLFDTVHVIGSDPVSAHVDPFGPFNPFHYLIQMPAMLLPSGAPMSGTCSLNGGCSF
jgi:hypothetical protein